MADKKEHLQNLISFLQRKGFVWGPEPEIYGGTAGFYTYAPLGKLLKNKIENTIRKTLEREGIFEVECPIIMERKVWEASGHLGGFSDAIITCSKCNANFRLDHLLGDYPETRHYKEPQEYLDFIKAHKIKCTACGSEFKQEIKKHDLMMRTTIGLDQEAYNRPETATTTYLPFLRYQEYFRRQPIFGVFQIGKAFRNEISPRQHILRMREFTQAEAQIFIKKELKNNYPKYKEVENCTLPFWDYKSQEKAEPVQKITVKEALERGYVKSQAYVWSLNLAYNLFRNVGIPENNIRLRQHFPDEKAFYADDAWDIEVNTKSFGWVEVCGVHDRTDYDLKQHAKFSGTPLEAYDEETKERYVPHILEIAFGADRPVFAVLDNFYEEKEKDDGKTTLKIPYHVSPIPVSVFPLMKKPELAEPAKRLQVELSKEFTCTYDETGAIGRRYLRAAEAGTAFCVTVDYESLEGEETVTLRDRDSEKQKRVKTKDISQLLRNLLSGELKFEDI